MKKEYIHQELNREVESISGYYVLEEEKVLDYKGRPVLYVIGHGVVEASCCGVGGCRYALVPGYIAEWKTKKTDSGLAVSEVEPISQEKAKGDIQSLIQEREVINQIQFS